MPIAATFFFVGLSSGEGLDFTQLGGGNPGSPPASSSAIESLPELVLSAEQLNQCKSSNCAVCQDDFEVGSKVKQLPCSHLYHDDCILPWLKLHSTCPVCRFQLPTDDSGCDSSKNPSRQEQERRPQAEDEWGQGLERLMREGAARRRRRRRDRGCVDVNPGQVNNGRP